MDLLDLLDPRGQRARNVVHPAPRLKTLSGKRVGMLDNHRAKSGLFLRRLAAILEAEYGVAEVVHAQKPEVSKPAPDAVYAAFSGVDCAVAGVGD